MLATCPGAVPSAASWGRVGASPPPGPLPLGGPPCLWPRWSASQRAHALGIRGPLPDLRQVYCGGVLACPVQSAGREPASGPHTEAEAEAWPLGAAPAPVSQRFPSTSSEPLGEKAVRLRPRSTRGPTSGRRAEPRPCGAHGASPLWASSPPLRPGPSLEHLFSHVSRLVLDVLPL